MKKSVILIPLLILIGGGMLYSLKPRLFGGSQTKPAVEAGQEMAKEEKSEEAVEKSREGEGMEIHLSPQERERIGLKTVKAEERPIEEVFAMTGVVQPMPNKVVFISSNLPAKVTAVHVNIGETVKAGAILAELASPEMERLQVQHLQAHNRLPLAKANSERTRTLVEGKIAAGKELLLAETEYQNTLREIQGLEKQLKILGLSEEEMEKAMSFPLRSPINGEVVERNISLGKSIGPEDLLFRIMNLSEVQVEGKAFEQSFPSLKKGLRVRITTSIYPDEVFTGEIFSISPEIHPEERTVHFWARVKNRGLTLKPNLFVRVVVSIGRKEEALAIPQGAVIEEGGRNFVFLDDGEGYRKVEVLLGATDDRFVAVKEGLSRGDQVVTTGKRQLLALSKAGREEGGLDAHGH